MALLDMIAEEITRIASSGLSEIRITATENNQNRLLRQLRSKYDTLSGEQIADIRNALGHTPTETRPCKACKVIAEREYRLAED